MMTPAQCRAGRGLVRWNQDDLAREAAVSVVTVRNFENEKSVPQRATLEVMQRALEAAGVEFIAENGGGPGVRLKKRSETVADLTRQIDIRQTDMTPESGHEKPSPNRAMKQLRRAHDQNELAVLKNRRAKSRQEENK
jgi:transcriptional regulator with XRE-family HTH domain